MIHQTTPVCKTCGSKEDLSENPTSEFGPAYVGHICEACWGLAEDDKDPSIDTNSEQYMNSLKFVVTDDGQSLTIVSPRKKTE